jgi:hypothetical protein
MSTIANVCPELPALFAGMIAELNERGVRYGLGGRNMATPIERLQADMLERIETEYRRHGAEAWHAAVVDGVRQFTIRSKLFASTTDLVLARHEADAAKLEILSAHATCLLLRAGGGFPLDELELTGPQLRRLEALLRARHEEDGPYRQQIREEHAALTAKLLGIVGAVRSLSQRYFGGRPFLLAEQQGALAGLENAVGEVEGVMALAVGTIDAAKIHAHAEQLATEIAAGLVRSAEAYADAAREANAASMLPKPDSATVN